MKIFFGINLVKKLIVMISFSLLLFISMNNITFANTNLEYNNIEIYNDISTTYYFDEGYKNDKYKLIKIFLSQNTKQNKIKSCIDFGKKYYKEKYILGCVTQIKYIIHSLYPTKYFNIKKEEFDIYYKYVRNFSSILLRNVSDLKLGEVSKTEEDTLLKPFINEELEFNIIIKKDLDNMIEAIKKDTGTHFKINSAHRDISRQDNIFKNYNSMYGVNQKIAIKPGHSEHHLGTTLDFGVSSKGYDWLKNNSYKYGFLQSYDTKDCLKYNVTIEGWHFRWIGLELANKWKEWKKDNKDLCNVDFYNILKNN